MLIIEIIAIIVTLFIFWIIFTILYKPKKEKKVIWVPMCPKCGSVNVKSTFLKGGSIMQSVSTSKSRCMDCKNVGLFPEVDIESLEDVRKQMKSRKSI
jgi:hypothetical protein